MKAWLLFVLALGAAVYHGAEWLRSPAYLNFLTKHKDKPWSSRALLKTAQYHVFAENWDEALVVLERCLSEDFKDRPEQGECLYERARCLDGQDRARQALAVYDEFLTQYPDHPRQKIARKRADVLRNSL